MNERSGFDEKDADLFNVVNDVYNRIFVKENI